MAVRARSSSTPWRGLDHERDRVCQSGNLTEVVGGAHPETGTYVLTPQPMRDAVVTPVVSSPPNVVVVGEAAARRRSPAGRGQTYGFRRVAGVL